MPLPAVSEDDKTGQELGRRMRAARSRGGMTRRQLAAASGTSERYLAHIEAGTGNPSISVLIAVAGALDMAVADLLPLGGERTESYEQATAAVRRLPQDRLESLQTWIDDAPRRPGEKAQRIVLLGLRGAGKTALGQALAQKLGVPFLEMSKEVEKSYGGDVGLLIELGGQGALHRYESESWEAIRTEYGRAVIAASGGIVAHGALYDRVLATSHSIWLQASPDDHMQRVIKQGDFRPMGRNPGAMRDLKAILSARAAEYSRADTSLDTSAQPFDETVEALSDVARDLLRR